MPHFTQQTYFLFIRSVCQCMTWVINQKHSSYLAFDNSTAPGLQYVEKQSSSKELSDIPVAMPNHNK